MSVLVKAEACCYEAGMERMHLTTAILRVRRFTWRPLVVAGSDAGLTNATLFGERKQLLIARTQCQGSRVRLKWMETY
jgi:hypothetical protein